MTPSAILRSNRDEKLTAFLRVSADQKTSENSDTQRDVHSWSRFLQKNFSQTFLNKCAISVFENFISLKNNAALFFCLYCILRGVFVKLALKLAISWRSSARKML